MLNDAREEVVSEEVYKSLRSVWSVVIGGHGCRYDQCLAWRMMQSPFHLPTLANLKEFQQLGKLPWFKNVNTPQSQ
jgi:hypothetical protein